MQNIIQEVRELRRHLQVLLGKPQPGQEAAYAHRVTNAKRALRRALAKLVVGLIILAALGYVLLNRNESTAPVTVYTLRYQGHRIPFDQLRAVDPHPGCEDEHYHAANGGSVTSVEGVVIPDSDLDCGYGLTGE